MNSFRVTQLLPVVFLMVCVHLKLMVMML